MFRLTKSTFLSSKSILEVLVYNKEDSYQLGFQFSYVQPTFTCSKLTKEQGVNIVNLEHVVAGWKVSERLCKSQNKMLVLHDNSLALVLQKDECL